MAETHPVFAPPVFELPTPDIAPWRSGNTGVEGVWRFESIQPGRCVMVSALVHGNEICGAWALCKLLEALSSGEVSLCQGSLILAFCNLDAFDSFDPNNADASRFVDEDLNRQWAPERIQAADTRERRRAGALAPFVAQADWLLDIHSMHDSGPPLMLTGVLARNIALAERLGAPLDVVVDAGHAQGVRMRDFGRLAAADGHPDGAGTCSLLIECGFHGALSSRDVAVDACARFLVESGAVQSMPSAWYLAPCATDSAGGMQGAQRIHTVTHAIAGKSAAFKFELPVSALASVPKKGTLLASDGDTQWHTPYDDCTLVMPSMRQLRPGVTVVRLATTR